MAATCCPTWVSQFAGTTTNRKRRSARLSRPRRRRPVGSFHAPKDSPGERSHSVWALLAACGCSSAGGEVEPGFTCASAARSASGSRSSTPSSERGSRCSFASGLTYAPKVKLGGTLPPGSRRDSGMVAPGRSRNSRSGRPCRRSSAGPMRSGGERDTRGERALRALADLTNRRRLALMAGLIAKIRGWLRIGKKP